MYDDYVEMAELLLYAMRAVRAHVSDVSRPRANELIGPEGFITELQSTSFTANGVFAMIAERHRQGMNFKTASTKPRNPANMANDVEKDVIETLDKLYLEGKEPVWQGVRNVDGTDFYITAVGEVNKPKCLQCHSTPDQAPQDMRDRYVVDQDQGYGRLVNRIESAEIVTIPVADITEHITRAQLLLFAILAAAIAILIGGVSLGLNVMFRPIVRVTGLAGLIADGNLVEASRELAHIKDRCSTIRAAEGKPRSADVTVKLVRAFSTMTRHLNSLIGKVQESAFQASSSAAEIAASARQIEATVAQQAASTSQVSATAKEISNRSKRLVGAMEDVALVASRTADLANEGQSSILDMESTMAQLMDATKSISSRLASINDKTADIGAIVVTITKVSEQTNLLSLNASIEAEKAGEFGLGFSVVAREIRRLADQTAVATLNIERMVKQMQSAVSSGVMEMDKFVKQVSHGVESVAEIGSRLATIIEQVQALTPRFEEANEVVQDQSAGADEISTAMSQLSEAAAQTKDSLSEFKRATDLLMNAASGLKDETSRFKTAQGPDAEEDDNA